MDACWRREVCFNAARPARGGLRIAEAPSYEFLFRQPVVDEHHVGVAAAADVGRLAFLTR